MGEEKALFRDRDCGTGRGLYGLCMTGFLVANAWLKREEGETYEGPAQYPEEEGPSFSSRKAV